MKGSELKEGVLFTKSSLYMRLFVAGAVLFSGLLWYYANDLSGNYGYLMWIAPVLVLFISLRTSWKVAFSAALVVSFIGRLSWYGYLTSVISVVPTLLFMLVASLIFAGIVVGARKIIITTNEWYSVFAFPVFVTVFEFVLIKFAPDGTAGSIAYSQLNYLPVIQIASVTGILGITFLLTLIPSAIVLMIYFRRSKNKLRIVLVTTGLIASTVLLFSFARINQNDTHKHAKVGIVVLDEKFHHITNQPNTTDEKITAEHYANEIATLAAQGALLVVLAERVINITKDNEYDMIALLSNTARNNRVFIILGYTNFRTDTTRNSALVIDADGKIIAHHDKARLIKVLEDQFMPGNSTTTFNFNGIVAGTAICKDLDFTDYINRYNETAVMMIPAWDFVVDGWLHSRMAILRGVENGFSEIRAARQGRLTISDCYGRITHETDCSDKKKATLFGDVSFEKRKTIYGQFGEWFGILNVMGLVLLSIVSLTKK
jgi:apolipoprotein N-acyltransferase